MALSAMGKTAHQIGAAIPFRTLARVGRKGFFAEDSKFQPAIDSLMLTGNGNLVSGAGLSTATTLFMK